MLNTGFGQLFACCARNSHRVLRENMKLCGDAQVDAVYVNKRLAFTIVSETFSIKILHDKNIQFIQNTILTVILKMLHVELKKMITEQTTWCFFYCNCVLIATVSTFSRKLNSAHKCNDRVLFRVAIGSENHWARDAKSFFFVTGNFSDCAGNFFKQHLLLEDCFTVYPFFINKTKAFSASHFITFFHNMRFDCLASQIQIGASLMVMVHINNQEEMPALDVWLSRRSHASDETNLIVLGQMKWPNDRKDKLFMNNVAFHHLKVGDIDPDLHHILIPCKHRFTWYDKNNLFLYWHI